MSSVRKGRKRRRNPNETQKDTSSLGDTCSKRSKNKTIGTDLISHLPDHILHTLIQNYLPVKDAARTCVLSKPWRAINYGNPFISLDECDFLPLPLQKHSIMVREREDIDILSPEFNYGNRMMHSRRKIQEEAAKKECHGLFMNYVESRMAGLVHHVEQLHLTIINFNHERDSPRLDLWLKHPFQTRVSNLILALFTEGQKEVVHSLPSSLFVSHTLAELKLANCKLGDASGNVKLPRLRKIFLSKLDLEDDFFKCLIFGCPMLEVMALTYCSKLTTILVTGLPRLESFGIKCCPDLKSVDIQLAPLQYIQYHVSPQIVKLELSTSNVIKQMVLSNIKITHRSWKYIADCEELMLIDVAFEEKLSSQKLRYLTIRRPYVRKVIKIDCPNLNGLYFFTVDDTKISKIIIELSLEDYQQHTSLSDKLKGYYFGNRCPITKFIKQSIIYSEDHEDVIILDGLIYKSTVPVLGEVKALMPKAKLAISTVDVEDLVDHFCGNSWNTLHQTLTIVSTRKKNSNFPQALYDELLRRKEKASYWEDGTNRCWWHKLSNVTKDSNANDVPTVLRSYKSKYYQISRILLKWKV